MYKPNTTPKSLSQQPVKNTSCEWHKVIISRQLLVNGQTVFIVGTKAGDIIHRDSQEVPLSKILDHVTPAELQRYENQDYLLEDAQEERRQLQKPRGRPRKGVELSKDASREQSTIPVVSHHGKASPGHPNKIAVVIPVFSPISKPGKIGAPTPFTPPKVIAQVPATPKVQSSISAGVLPFANPKFSVSESSGSRTQFHSPKTTRRPQYSMVAASGLAPSDTSSDENLSRNTSTSRAESHDPISLDQEPFLKRRKLTPVRTVPNRASSPSRQLIEYSNGSGSDSGSEGVEPVDTIDMREEDVERETLLRQFQPRIPSDTASAAKIMTPPKTIPRRASITPCFPRMARNSSKPSGNSLSNVRNLAVRPLGTTSESAKVVSLKPPVSSQKLDTSNESDSHISEPLNKHPVAKQNDSANHAISVFRKDDFRPRIPKFFAPTTDITAYFRPKSKPTANPVQPPVPSATDTESESDSKSETESEDHLAQAPPFNHPTSNLQIAQHPSPRNSARISAPTTITIDSDETEVSSDDSLNRETIVVQRRSKQNSLAAPSFNPSLKRKPTEIPDSEDEGRNWRPEPARSTAFPSRFGAEVDESEDESSGAESRDSDVMIVDGPV